MAKSDITSGDSQAPALDAAPAPAAKPVEDKLVTVANRKNYQIPFKVLENGKAVEIICAPHGRSPVYQSQLILPLPAGLILVGA